MKDIPHKTKTHGNKKSLKELFFQYALENKDFSFLWYQILCLHTVINSKLLEGPSGQMKL